MRYISELNLFILYRKMRTFVWLGLMAALMAMPFRSLAQQPLIFGLDSLCVNNDLQLSTTVKNASSYYWGFCSAYLNNIPTGSSIGAGTGMDSPSSIAMGKDGQNYFVFVVNTAGSRNIIRYDFGNSLSNSPVPVNLGNFGSKIPVTAKGFELVNHNGQWYGFISGGSTAINSQLVRLDFGNSLSNTPTLSDLGNLSGLLINPQDLFVFSDSTDWYILTAEGFTGNLIRLDLGNSLTNNTPTLVNLGNPGSLSFPTGFWPVKDGVNWHLFVVNRLSQTISRVDFGNSLLNPAVETNLGNFNNTMNGPRDISIIKDCGKFYAYVTNEANNSMVMLDFGGSITNVPTETDLGNFGGFSAPRYLTRFIRSKDNVFSFTANNTSNSLTRLSYLSCNASTIPSSTLQTPPPIRYTTPGLYNIYFVSDEGLPTMQVDCKLVKVIAMPPVEIHNDTTICNGDTILLVANGQGLYSNVWNPVYNTIPPYDTTSIRIYPNEDYRYHTRLEFLPMGGCRLDTSVMVKVSRVIADAGPDRWVADGAPTVLGGPRNSTGQEYSYLWEPNLWLDKNYIATPECRPRDVQAYYLTVTNDSSSCVATDTVWVRTECTEVNMPNVFNPQSDIADNRNFGILNNNIVKVNYFRIYNRWGELVFETVDKNKKWDGTQNNIQLPPDNYVWIVDALCDNGKRIKKQGTVLLVR